VSCDSTSQPVLRSILTVSSDLLLQPKWHDSGDVTHVREGIRGGYWLFEDVQWHGWLAIQQLPQWTAISRSMTLNQLPRPTTIGDSVTAIGDVSPTLNGIGENHLQLESPANDRAPVQRRCLEPLIGGYAAAVMASKA